jgi:hypothetical protein
VRIWAKACPTRRLFAEVAQFLPTETDWQAVLRYGTRRNGRFGAMARLIGASGTIGAKPSSKLRIY